MSGTPLNFAATGSADSDMSELELSGSGAPVNWNSAPEQKNNDDNAPPLEETSSWAATKNTPDKRDTGISISEEEDISPAGQTPVKKKLQEPFHSPRTVAATRRKQEIVTGPIDDDDIEDFEEEIQILASGRYKGSEYVMNPEKITLFQALPVARRDEFCFGVGKNKLLNRLILNNVGLDDESGGELVKSLKKYGAPIVHLELDGNKFSNHTLARLADLMRSSDTILHVSMVKQEQKKDPSRGEVEDGVASAISSNGGVLRFFYDKWASDSAREHVQKALQDNNTRKMVKGSDFLGPSPVLSGQVLKRKESFYVHEEDIQLLASGRFDGETYEVTEQKAELFKALPPALKANLFLNLGKNKYLNRLILNGCGLRDEDGAQICKSLKKYNCPLIHLELNENNLSNDTLLRLGEFIRTSPTILSVSITKQNQGKERSRGEIEDGLATAIHHNKRILHFNYDKWRSDSSQAMAEESLAKNNTRTVVPGIFKIQGHANTVPQPPSLARQKSIETLEERIGLLSNGLFRGTEFILDGEEIGALFAVLPPALKASFYTNVGKNKNLTRLVLNGCSLLDVDGEQLLKSFKKHNTPIIHLALNGNSLSNLSMSAMSALLKSNTTLLDISLQQQNQEDQVRMEVETELANRISTNHSLMRFEYSHWQSHSNEAKVRNALDTHTQGKSIDAKMLPTSPRSESKMQQLEDKVALLINGLFEGKEFIVNHLFSKLAPGLRDRFYENVGKNPNLSHLIMNNAQISDENGAALCKSLKKYKCQIVRLELDGNELGDDSIFRLSDFLRNSKSLLHVTMKGQTPKIKTSPSVEAELARAVDANKRILSFERRWSTQSDEDLVKKAVQRNAGLANKHMYE